ncbi:unnamed protein product [Thlaspi arvense]|uniref:PHD-type domain-containing protein n=1 Tax=Thlaspi arvense TaxID=13288 RepID=A0AAU9TAL2_THLAR|nr:unnamed protein product [Thlaspi arvense]
MVSSSCNTLPLSPTGIPVSTISDGILQSHNLNRRSSSSSSTNSCSSQWQLFPRPIRRLEHDVAVKKIDKAKASASSSNCSKFQIYFIGNLEFMDLSLVPGVMLLTTAMPTSSTQGGFLSYTCCDACGRLFVKGNYCPVCLKVYRDSESTPMVCCDICQRWVHCRCDGISDAKYLQFQVDGNLQYKCATCRGECYQVKDHQDAVQELWKKKDVVDKDLVATLRANRGRNIFDIPVFR